MPVSRKEYLLAVGLVILTMSVYWQVTGFDFVHFDDGVYVAKNPRLPDGVSLDDVRWSFTTTTMGAWNPFVWFSFLIDVLCFGEDAGGFHLSNVVFHVANTLLLFVWLRTTTGAVGKSAFVAAIFAVHPLHVESVAWISSRKDVLSTLFGLLALIGYTKYVQSQKSSCYVAALTAFGCSLMSKQMLVTLPFVMLLLDVWPLGRLDLSRDVQRIKPLIVEKIPFFVVTLLMCVVAYVGQRAGGGTDAIEGLSLPTRLLNAVLSYGLYVRQSVFPWNLSVLYPHPGNGISMLPVAFAGAVVIAVSVVAAKWRKQNPWGIVGWFWFLGTLVPVIGLVQIGRQQMADRYMYFPLIGLSIAFTWTVASVCRPRSWIEYLLPKLAYLTVGAATVAAWFQTGYWKDSETLFGRAIAVTENNAVMHFNLGRTLQEKRQSNAAIAHYRRATEIDPTYARPHSAWAVALAEQRMYGEAKKHFERAIKLSPRMVQAHTGLGNIELAMGQIDVAIRHYRTAIEIDAQHANAHYNLGLALHEKKAFQDALVEFDLALRIEPGNQRYRKRLAEQLNAVGEELMQQERPHEAATHFRNALQLQPNFARARANLRRVEK